MLTAHTVVGFLLAIFLALAGYWAFISHTWELTALHTVAQVVAHRK